MRAMLIVLGLVFNSALVHANDTKKCTHSVDTAKATLSAIYAAQKSHYAETKSYGAEFGDIGYDPNFEAADTGACDMDNWDFSLQAADGDAHFTASAHSRITGKEIRITEKNEINTKGLEISASPQDD